MTNANTQQSIAILGPTSSGKSDLAIALAQDYNGEVIGVDSRQVYRHMDIGSGKITAAEQALVPHHLLDVAHPNDEYNIALFLRDARQVQQEILSRNHLPVLCGGTGFWMQAFVEDHRLPEVPPNVTLRKNLETSTTQELYARLEKKDAARATAVGPHSRVHLVRALEIIEALGMVPPLPSPDYDTIQKHWLILALLPERDVLYESIESRMAARVAAGMLAETQMLHEQERVSWERLEGFGMEYKRTAEHLQGKISAEEMVSQMIQDSRNYAKRQITWIRRWERAGAPVIRITTLDEAREHLGAFLRLL